MSNRDDKTSVLTKAHGFRTIIPPKKNRKSPCFYDKQLYKQRNNIERYLFRLKHFIRAFTRYDKLDSFLYLSSLSLLFSTSFLCERCLIQKQE